MKVNLLQGTYTPTLTPMPGVHHAMEPAAPGCHRVRAASQREAISRPLGKVAKKVQGSAWHQTAVRVGFIAKVIDNEHHYGVKPDSGRNL
jgi:hypothetical protein